MFPILMPLKAVNIGKTMALKVDMAAEIEVLPREKKPTLKYNGIHAVQVILHRDAVAPMMATSEWCTEKRMAVVRLLTDEEEAAILNRETITSFTLRRSNIPTFSESATGLISVDGTPKAGKVGYTNRGSALITTLVDTH